MRSISFSSMFLTALSLVTFAAACSNSTAGDFPLDRASSPLTAPSNLIYSANPAVFTRGTNITDDVPSNSGGTPTSYAITPGLPGGLTFSDSNGVISGSPNVIAAEQTYTVTASNNGGSTTAKLKLSVVNPEAPAGLTYATNPAVYLQGTMIADDVPSSSGGLITSYSISPALPAGLSLSPPTGVLSGTPTVPATAKAYTVTGTNLGGSTTVSLEIMVKKLPAPSSLTYSENPAVYTETEVIPNNVPTSKGGAVSSYSISPTLPAGLDLQSTTGVISGTPTAVSAARTYTVTASNLGGSTTAALSITVKKLPAPSGLTYSTNPAVYYKGQQIADNIPSSSGGPVASFAITPHLPAGLAFDTTNGVISGAPSAISAKTSYKVMATNVGGSTTASLVVTVTTLPPPADLTYPVNPAAFDVNVAITDDVPSETGGAVTSYAISPALPAGLKFSKTTGAISGTPTAVTVAKNQTVTATNAGGSTTATLSIQVVCTSDSSCTGSERCCVIDGACHPTVSGSEDCDCAHPCAAARACVQSICGSTPPRCVAGCNPGSTTGEGTLPETCADVEVDGGMQPAFCTPLAADLVTTENQGGGCVTADGCNVVTQNCPRMPLDRSRPKGSDNPLVQYNCLPVAPNLTGCFPAGDVAVDGTNCAQICGSVDGGTAAVASNCAAGSECVQVVSDGEPIGSPVCKQQCASPVSTGALDSACSGGDQTCEGVYQPFGEQMLDFSTGTCCVAELYSCTTDAECCNGTCVGDTCE